MGFGMSFGDELMAAGQAETFYQRTGKPCSIVNKHGNPRWSDLWNGNPAIDRTAEHAITNGPGCRPYIEYPFSIESGQTYTNWRAQDNRAKFYPTIDEMEFAHNQKKPFAIIEPNLAQKSNPNKKWPWYSELVQAMPDVNWVQIGPRGTELLDGVTHIQTPDFRYAMAIMSAASLYVGPEGGLHHAAATVGTPAFVIYGAHPLGPTSYPEQVNITEDSHDAWMPWLPCDHCSDAMRAISVDRVRREVERLWQD